MELLKNTTATIINILQFLIQILNRTQAQETPVSSSRETRESPGWCSSVDWVQVCEPKDYQSGSQSEHKPGLCARSPVGGMQEATTQWCFLLFLFPLSLKINKYFFLKKEKPKWALELLDLFMFKSTLIKRIPGCELNR